MNALLIGADSLGKIPEILASYNIRIAQHISGRNTAHSRKTTLPKNTELLILLTDFLCHNAMRHYRDTAAARGIPVLACRRSATAVQHRLQHDGWKLH